jgi:hypothetical protein
VLRESGQGRKLLRTEAAHDARGVAAVPLIAQRKAAHGGAGQFGPGELVVDVLELVRWIDGELPLVLGAVGDIEPGAVLRVVEVGAGGHSPQVRNVPHQQPEHVVEGAILEHQDDDVFDPRVGRVRSRLRLDRSHPRARGQHRTARHQREPCPSAKCHLDLQITTCSEGPDIPRGPRLLAVAP